MYIKPSQLGFCLFEVIIAIFILTLSMLITISSYANLLQQTNKSHWHTMIISQLASMAEQATILDQTHMDWNIQCQQLLPHGTCSHNNNKIIGCFYYKNNNQCYELKL